MAPPDLTVDVLGWPPDGPSLRLDHERFSYAGKFVMTNTGKAVARAAGDDAPIAAVAFNEDRTDPSTCWLRYVTVRADHRGEGIGPHLVGVVRDRALDRGYDGIRIAVNNPFAYQALYRAGFDYTDETTGIAELILEFPPTTGSDPERYRAGLERFRDRDEALSDDEREFVADRLERGPPSRIDDSDRRDGHRD